MMSVPLYTKIRLHTALNFVYLNLIFFRFPHFCYEILAIYYCTCWNVNLKELSVFFN